MSVNYYNVFIWVLKFLCCLISPIVACVIMVLALVDYLFLLIFNQLAIIERFEEWIKVINKKDVDNRIKPNKPEKLYGNDLRNDFKAYETVNVTIIFYLMKLKYFYREGTLAQFCEYLSYFPPDKRVTANDLLFLMEETPLFITMGYEVEKTLSFSSFKYHLWKRWIVFDSKFTSVIKKKYGRTTWINLGAKFDISNHIITIDLDDERKLSQKIQEVYLLKLPKDKPLWRVYYIILPTKIYILFKIHHTICDGSSLMTITSDRLADIPLDRSILPLKYQKNVNLGLRILYYFTQAIYTSVVGLGVLLEYYLKSSDRKSFVTNQLIDKNNIIFGKRYLSDYNEIDLLMIKKIIRLFSEKKHDGSKFKNKFTVNDILLFLLSHVYAEFKSVDKIKSTLYELANQKYKTNDEIPLNENYVDKENVVRSSTESIILNCQYKERTTSMDVMSMENSFSMDTNPIKPQEFANSAIIIPFMCRTAAPTCFDNQTSMVSVNLQIPETSGFETSKISFSDSSLFRKQLLQIKQSLNKCKKRNMGMVVYLLSLGIVAALPVSLSKKIYKAMYSHTEFSSTNVAAPFITGNFANCRINKLMFWPAPHETCSVSTSWISLGNNMQIMTIMSETEIEELSNQLVKCFDGSEMDKWIFRNISLLAPSIIGMMVQKKLKILANTLSKYDMEGVVID